MTPEQKRKRDLMLSFLAPEIREEVAQRFEREVANEKRHLQSPAYGQYDFLSDLYKPIETIGIRREVDGVIVKEQRPMTTEERAQQIRNDALMAARELTGLDYYSPEPDAIGLEKRNKYDFMENVYSLDDDIMRNIEFGRLGIPMIDPLPRDYGIVNNPRSEGPVVRSLSGKERTTEMIAHLVDNARARGIPERDIRDFYGLDTNPNLIGIDLSDPKFLRSPPPGNPTKQTRAFETRSSLIDPALMDELREAGFPESQRSVPFRKRPVQEPQENTLRTRMDEMRPQEPQEPITFSELLSPFVKVKAQDFTPERKSKSKRGFVSADEAFDFSSLSEK